MKQTILIAIITRGKDAAVSTAKAKGFWWSMRSILLCIIAAWTLLLCTLSLTGCDNGNTETHTHAYAAAWTSDATQHWRYTAKVPGTGICAILR